MENYDTKPKKKKKTRLGDETIIYIKEMFI